MYKCKECGAQFDKKPDFCDCGNDIFEEVIDGNSIKKENIKKEPSILRRNLPSVIFLVFCLILSFIILFFIGNPKDKPIKKEVTKQEKAKNIPDIEKIWDSTPPKKAVIKPQIQQEIITPKTTAVELKKEPATLNQPQIQNKVLPVIQKPLQTKPKEVKQVQAVRPQNTKSKTQSINKAQQTNQKPQQTAQTPKQTVQKQQQTTQKSVQQQTQTQSQPKTQQQIQTPQQQTNVQVSAPTKQEPVYSQEELKQYKKALRNKIASNINFLNIAGDGKCILSFSISPSGTLLNRKFVSQSSNTSLNDAVYSAMLQVSSFKAPPAGYRNETMKLTVQISGGNFSVSLE